MLELLVDIELTVEEKSFVEWAMITEDIDSVRIKILYEKYFSYGRERN